MSERTFGFIGVSTAQSAIMRVFPAWAKYLGLGPVAMRGHDLPIHANPARYREVVAEIKRDRGYLGALVTAHKIDLFQACQDMFDYVDPYAELLGEVSSLSKRDGQLRAHAKDPISSGRAFDHFVREGYWTDTEAEALLLGAGGSDLAISVHLMTVRDPSDRPQRIVVVNRSAGRLDSMRALHEQLASKTEVAYIHNPDPGENDRLMARLPAGSLVVNGTGMGKDSPGSPVTWDGLFPERGLVWELNYRGELEFLQQARRQERPRHLIIEDGWRYFVHGWTCVMEEVFGLTIEPTVFKRLSEIASDHR